MSCLSKFRIENDEKKVYDAIENLHQSLYEYNIPKLQAETAFNRRELHKLFIKYKALCAQYGLTRVRQKKDYSKR